MSDPAEAVAKQIAGKYLQRDCYGKQYGDHDEICTFCQMVDRLTAFAAQQVYEEIATLRLALDNANKLIGAKADECEQTVKTRERAVWEEVAETVWKLCHARCQSESECTLAQEFRRRSRAIQEEK